MLTEPARMKAEATATAGKVGTRPSRARPDGTVIC